MDTTPWEKIARAEAEVFAGKWQISIKEILEDIFVAKKNLEIAKKSDYLKKQLNENSSLSSESKEKLKKSIAKMDLINQKANEKIQQYLKNVDLLNTLKKWFSGQWEALKSRESNDHGLIIYVKLVSNLPSEIGKKIYIELSNSRLFVDKFDQVCESNSLPNPFKE